MNIPEVLVQLKEIEAARIRVMEWVSKYETGNDPECLKFMMKEFVELCRIEEEVEESYGIWLSEETVLDAVRGLEIAIESLNVVACWEGGPTVSMHFDSPGDASVARSALGRIGSLFREKT
jgi:hypothetical protein